jgi:hypothetical protein
MLHFLLTTHARTTTLRSRRYSREQAKSYLPSPLEPSVMHFLTDNCRTSGIPVRHLYG